MKKLKEYLQKRIEELGQQRRGAQSMGNPAYERVLYGSCQAFIEVLEEINKREKKGTKK